MIPKSKLIKRKVKVTIRALGIEKLSKIAREVTLLLKKDLGQQGVRVKSWHDGDLHFWERGGSQRLDPSPVVYQVAAMQKVFVQLSTQHLPVKITPESGAGSKLEIQIS